MTRSSREWMLWFGVALTGALLLCSCTTELERTALSHLAEHVEQLATEADDVARATPPDSEIAPVVETMRWRIRSRAKPIADELRRIKGPRVVDIPMNQHDMTAAMITETAMLDELKAEPPEGSQFPLGQTGGAGGIGWGIIATVIGGGGGAGMLKLVRRWLQSQKARLMEAQSEATAARQVNSEMHLALDILKHKSEEFKKAVSDVTGKNDRIKLSYEEYRTQQARQTKQHHNHAEAMLPGVAA